MAVHLLRALRSAGYRTVLVHRWGGPLEAELDRAADSSRREPLRRLRALLRRSRITKPLAARLEAATAKWTMKRVKPDLVWCNTVVTARYAQAARSMGLPAVLYSHEQSEWSTGLTGVIESGGQAQADLDAPLTLVACSRSAGHELESALGRPLGSVALLHSPVDLEEMELHAGALDGHSPRPVVAACGRADTRKGFDVFVEAAKLDEQSGGRALWRWIGEPPEELPELPSNLELSGEVVDARDAIAEATVFVCPSRADSFPLVILEAMALARPVVASSISGPQEQLGETGVFVEPADSQALLSAVTTLLDDPAERERLGKLAKERCSRLWGLGPFADRVRELTESALDSDGVRDRHLVVLHLMGRLSPGGGVQVVVRRLADHTDASAVDLHVGTIRPPWDDLSDVPVTLHTLDFDGSRMTPWDRVTLMARAARLARRIRPDVIHLHSGTSWLGLLARLTRRNCAFVIEVHDAPGSGRQSDASDRFEAWCARGLGMHMACHSVQVQEALNERSRVDLAAISRFPLGIDTDTFIPAESDTRAELRSRHGLDPDDVAAIAIGRAARSKRFDLAVEALCRAAEEYESARLVLVGPGAHADLEEVVETRAASARVQLLEARFGADLAGTIAACDVLLSTSEYEGFGLTIVEGMACGLPVVATAVGGVTDLVEDGVTGFLVPPGDVGALAERLEQLCASPELRARMGAAGRKRAVTLFDARRTASSFESLYGKLAQP